MAQISIIKLKDIKEAKEHLKKAKKLVEEEIEST